MGVDTNMAIHHGPYTTDRTNYRFLFNPNDQDVSIGGSTVTVKGSGFSGLGSGPAGQLNQTGYYFGRGARFTTEVSGQIIGAGIGNNLQTFSGYLYDEANGTGNSSHVRNWSFSALSSNSNWLFQYTIFGTAYTASAGAIFRMFNYSWTSPRSMGYAPDDTLDGVTQPSGELTYEAPISMFSTGAFPVYPATIETGVNYAMDIIFLPD